MIFKQLSFLVATGLLISGAVYAQNSAPSTAATARDVYADTWIAVDGLGRNVAGPELAGAPRQNRTVGMFYYIWHDHNHARDNSKILKNFPEIAAHPEDPAVWAKYGFDNAGRPRHHWGEPLFGYYRSNDEWVIRKHAQMLSDAGVDTIIFDTSNVDARNNRDLSKHYIQNAVAVCRVFSEIRDAGGRAPAFVFLTNGADGRSASMIQWLYDNIYSKGLYKSAWFSWPDYSDGDKVKPLVLGYDWETAPALNKYFTIRYSWAFDSAKRPKGTSGEGTRQKTWPWTDEYPQRPSWGKNPGDLQSLSIAVDNGPIYGGWGRSYRNGKSEYSTGNIAYPGVESKYGLFFGEQWDRVWTGNAPWVEPSRRFEGVPPFLFLTQWNEWSASRWDAAAHPKSGIPAVPDRFVHQTLSAGDSYFVDEFNAEWSRDMEPDKSGTSDNYYQQVIDNARRYKGVRAVENASAPRDFGLADFGVWPQIGPEFRDDGGDTFARANQPGLGFDQSSDPTNKTVPLVYNNRSGRNDFVSARAAIGTRGELTFWAQTAAPIVGPRDTNWMNIYIRDLNSARPNWSGFSTRIAPDEKGAMRLYRYDGDGLNWKWLDTGAKVLTAVGGDQIVVRVQGADLGLVAGAPLDIAFKWADNCLSATPDPTDFLVNGDCAPNARFAYHLRSADAATAPMPIVSGQIYALKNRASGLVAQTFNEIGSDRAEGTRVRLVPVATVERPDKQLWKAQNGGGNAWHFASFDAGHNLGGARRYASEKGDDRARIWRADVPNIDDSWEVRAADNGGFRLIQRATNLALTARASARADGGDEDNIVRLAAPSDDKMQIWELVPMRDYKTAW